MKIKIGLRLLCESALSSAFLFGCATTGHGDRAPASVASPSPTSTPLPTPQLNDPYIWLENSKDPKVMSWILPHNEKVEKQLTADPRAKTIAEQVSKIITAKDRIPMPHLVNGRIRNFWQDADHVRGIWRETTIKDYQKSNPKWETLLDIDALNRDEKKSFVFEGAYCLEPDEDLCLIQLSDAGRDEAEFREYQVSQRKFIAGGFNLPPAKSEVSWIDRDHLFVETKVGGDDSLTTSGYPRQVRLWARGTPIESARVIFSADKAHVSARAWMSNRPESNFMFVQDSVSFFQDETFLFTAPNDLKKLPFPATSRFHGEFNGQLIASLRDDWKVGPKTYAAGSVLSLPIISMNREEALSSLETIFVPNGKTAFNGIDLTKNFIELEVLNNVRGEIHQISRHKNKWISTKLALPSNGTVAIATVDAFDDKNRVYLSYQTFNQPTTLSMFEAKKAKRTLKKVKQLPARYDAHDVVFDQYFSKSKDGTKIPYFVVHKKKMKRDGSNPTLLYAYGGFERSQTPFYLGAIGKVWIEKGGVYVLANIRGGGEFGPKWHEAVLKEKRPRVYEDFASVAEDLVARKITSPRRLGIQGGSNGGLLVGTAVTQHPDYYHAVVCESALLDMIRYTKMPPGASWIGEYGDPDDAKMAAIIATYSPYQNVRAGVKYPKLFFHISTADDRVQPGHTRKMVERLQEYGNDVLMFENTEGGHGGAADLQQRVKKTMLEYVYLYQQLMD